MWHLLRELLQRLVRWMRSLAYLEIIDWKRGIWRTVISSDALLYPKLYWYQRNNNYGTDTRYYKWFWLHRDNDDPAVCWTNDEEYYKSWYVNGQQHREKDKPAVIVFALLGITQNYGRYSRLEWYQRGLAHREKLPAILIDVGGFFWWEWLHFDKHHRYDGPAFVYDARLFSTREEYYVNGVETTPKILSIVHKTVKNWKRKLAQRYEGRLVDIGFLPKDIVTQLIMPYLFSSYSIPVELC
jgi:hypothetical protein